MTEPFSPQQRRVLWACVALYTAAYFNRLNLSAALGSVMDALAMDAAQAGLLPTAFAAAYAAGQFVNGALVDRLNPVRHMLAGLLGSAACNLLLGMSGGFPMMLALCVGNGACQSMMWTPIVRLLALYFREGRPRERANMMVTASFVAGHFGAWMISGYLAALTGWRCSFIVPAAIALPALWGASRLLRGVRAGQAAAAGRGGARPAPAWPLFRATGFPLMLGACVLYGFARDGVVTWAPTLLRAAGGERLSATAVTLVIPAVNAFGLWAGYALLRRGRADCRLLIALLMLCAAAFALPLPAAALLPQALLMGCACACLYGLNPMLTALVPLAYDRAGRVGLAAGLIDSLIYVGSALVGLAGGQVYARLGSHALYMSWAAALLTGSALAAMSGRRAYLRALERAGDGKTSCTGKESTPGDLL